MAIDTTRFIGRGEIVEVKLVTGGTIKYGDLVSSLTGGAAGVSGFCTASTSALNGEIVMGTCMGSEQDLSSLGTKTFPVWVGLTRLDALNAAVNDVGKDFYVHDKTTLTGSTEGPKVGVCVKRESATKVIVRVGVASLGE